MPGNRRINIADRYRLIEAHERGEDFLPLAAQLGVNRSSAYSIIRLHQEQHRVEPLPHRGGRPRAIDNESIDFAIMLLEAYPLMTLGQLKQEINTVFSSKPAFS